MTPYVLKTVIERKDPLDLFVHSPTLCLSLFPLKQQFFFVLPLPSQFCLAKTLQGASADLNLAQTARMTA